MYHFFKGRGRTKGSVAPAIKRAIIEMELIDEFHWLPQDIEKIPYKQLQLFYIIRRQQRESANEKQQLDRQIQESKSRGVDSSREQHKRKF